MTGRKVLFSAQKNEGPFILEWVAYHKVIGFTDIVVVSNDCTDGSDDLLDALQDAGELTHIRQVVPDDVSPQINAQRVARDKGVFRNGDWVMWLDLDEFLLVSSGDRNVKDLIAAIGGARAVSIAWRFFGDGGNGVWPGRQITAAFTKAERRRRNSFPQVKTLFLYDEKIARLDIHRPILAAEVTAVEFPWITSTGKPVDENFYNSRRQRAANRILDPIRYYKLGQVMHFSVRTLDIFSYKTERGDGCYPADDETVVRDQVFYQKKNKNHVDEQAALALEGPTVKEMERLVAQPRIKAACEAIRGFKWLPYPTG